MDTARITTILNIGALVAIMISMGLQVRLTEIAAVTRQSRLILLGVLGNYVAVPLVTLGLLRWFQADPMVAAGFLILAVCPGAPVAPPFTAIAKGSLTVAVGLMLILAVLSAFLSPLLLSWLLVRLTAHSELHVDFLAIIGTLLVAQILPLGLGLAVRHRSPKLAERINRPVGRLANLLLILLVVMILVSQYPTLADIRLRGWFGMGLLLAVSLAIGWVCGGRDIRTRKAMAITTAARNAAVGLVIANTNFAETPAVTAVVAYGLVSMLGALAFASVVAGGMSSVSPDRSA